MRKRLMGNYQPKKGVQSKEDGICIFYVMRDCKNNLFFITIILQIKIFLVKKGKNLPIINKLF